MNSLKGKTFTLGSIIFFLCSHFSYALAAEPMHSQTPAIGGRIQAWGVAEKLNDEYRDNNRLYLFVKQARLWAVGKKSDINYKLQLGFAGSESTVATKTGVALNLLDAYADVPYSSETFFRIGQFKVPFSRERISDSGYHFFADPSLGRMAFDLERDSGVAVHSRFGDFLATLGVFTGGGRDLPERYLPEELGLPLIAFRAGFSSMENNIYDIKNTDRLPGMCLFINGVYTKDSLVGHSTALNVDLGNRTLFNNSNWNPYIAKRDAGELDAGTMWHLGTDFIYRTDNYFGGFEVNTGKFENKHGSIRISSAEVESGIFISEQRDVALRYSVLYPDKSFAYSDTESGTDFDLIKHNIPFQSVNVASTYYMANKEAKFIFDLTYLIDIPVVSETGIGSYAVTQQPDQVSNLAKAGSTIERQNIVQARLLFQLMF